jgi:Ca2+/H+ antiporter
MSVVVDYLIVLAVAVIAFSLPDLFAVYSGVHLDRTVTLLGGLALVYLVLWFQMRRRKRDNTGDAPPTQRSVLGWILICGFWIAAVYLMAPIVVDAIWPVATKQ